MRNDHKSAVMAKPFVMTACSNRASIISNSYKLESKRVNIAEMTYWDFCNYLNNLLLPVQCQPIFDNTPNFTLWEFYLRIELKKEHAYQYISGGNYSNLMSR